MLGNSVRSDIKVEPENGERPREGSLIARCCKIVNMKHVFKVCKIKSKSAEYFKLPSYKHQADDFVLFLRCFLVNLSKLDPNCGRLSSCLGLLSYSSAMTHNILTHYYTRKTPET